MLKLTAITDSHITASAQPIRDGGMAAALSDATTWGADAFIHTGDIGDNNIAGVRRGFTMLRGAALPMPLIYVIGNHDENELNEGGMYGPGNPNTPLIIASDCFSRSAPMQYTTTIKAADGDLTARVIGLDCNYYNVSAADPTVVNSAHVAGDRVGHSGDTEPPGGSYRQFKQAQRDFAQATLAADMTSHMILLLIHYPPVGPGPTDYKLLADILQADGRPVAWLVGHEHSHAKTYTLTTTDGARVYTAYKVPACQESGAYARVRVHLFQGRVVYEELTVKNFQQPGGWVINPPFVLG